MMDKAAGPIDYVARWRALVEARHEQGRRLDREHGRADAWAGGRAQRFGRLVANTQRSDPLLEEAIAFLTPATTVLDVGAGTGRHAIPLAERAKRVVAVEPSAAMRGQLERNAEEADVSLEIVDGTWPEIEVDPADLVICAHVVYGTADIEGFVRRLDAITRRRCIMALRTGQREQQTLELFEKVWGEPRQLAPVATDLYGVLTQLGIRARVRPIPFPRPRPVASVDEAMAYVRGDLLNPSEPRATSEVRRFVEANLVPAEEGFEWTASEQWSALISWDKESGDDRGGRPRRRRGFA